MSACTRARQDLPVAAATPPRISVVMPVYNALPYLPSAIDSILEQTFRDFELILVDDASTDGSSGVLADYAAKDRRVRVVTNARNLGIAGALNVGLDAARGEFIARMDGDDISLPNRFRRQIEFLDAHPDHVLVGTNYSMIDATGQVRLKDFNKKSLDNWELNWTIHFLTPIVHPTAMFRGCLVHNSGIRYDEKYTNAAEDLDFFIRILKLGKGFILREVLFEYRWHGNSTTLRIFHDQKKEIRDISLNNIIVRYPDLASSVPKLKPLFDMLARDGVDGAAPLSTIVDAMALIEQRFLGGRRLTTKQRLRVHRLAARWMLWALFAAGKLRPSREMINLLWRARGYWPYFLWDCMSFEGMSIAFYLYRRNRSSARSGPTDAVAAD